jgi:catechol 2,3-dioxygenase-like lactoylglutathione lyase family enzyme
MSQPSAGVKHIAQVAIVCRDIEATARRWAALLNVPVPRISTTRPGEQTKMTYRGRPSNAQVKLAFFDTGACQLELLQPLGGDSSWQEGLDRNGESVHHIAFQVQNVEASIAAMTAAGMPLIHRGRYDDDSGTYPYMDTQRHLGAMVELLQSDRAKKG